MDGRSKVRFGLGFAIVRRPRSMETSELVMTAAFSRRAARTFQIERPIEVAHLGERRVVWKNSRSQIRGGEIGVRQYCAGQVCARKFGHAPSCSPLDWRSSDWRIPDRCAIDWPPQISALEIYRFQNTAHEPHRLVRMSALALAPTSLERTMVAPVRLPVMRAPLRSAPSSFARCIWVPSSDASVRLRP